MNARIYRRAIGLVLAVLLCAAAIAYAEESASPMDDPEAYVQNRYTQLLEELGPFSQWSLEQRAAFNQLQIALGTPTDDETFVHGVPGEEDIPWYTALSIAREAFESTFDLTVEALDGYAAQYAFNVANAERPVWKIELIPFESGVPQPAGAYTAYVLARTGALDGVYGPGEDSHG